jgi:aspartate 1-decarboxylase
MQIQLLKSKIHKARVTAASVDYEGSLTIPTDLMELAGMVPYERILVGNMANGARFETYAIPGKTGSGQFELNGATAHLGKPGDELTIMAFGLTDASQGLGWTPRVVVLNAHNRIAKERGL